MIQVDVRADIRQAERFLTNLRKNAVKMAAARAINDTITTIRAEGARAIKQDHVALKIGDIKNNMTVKKAHKYNLRGMVATKGGALSMLLFRPLGGNRGFRFGRTSRAGIYNVTRAARAKAVTAVIGKKRAVMQMQGRKAFRIGAYGNEVFVRRHPSGRGVRKLRGPSMPGVFRAKGSFMERLALERWRKTFASRMKYEIELAKRGAK